MVKTLKIGFSNIGYLLLGHLLSGCILNHLMHSKVAECIRNVTQRNAKRCVCWTHVCTKTTIINDNDMDRTSIDLIYVIT